MLLKCKTKKRESEQSEQRHWIAAINMGGMGLCWVGLGVDCLLPVMTVCLQSARKSDGERGMKDIT